MKVNVLQVEQAKFHGFLHFWSNWVDVAVYDYASRPYLLQMSVNRFNRKRFRSTRMTGQFMYRQSTCREIGDLMPMSITQNRGNHETRP